MRSIEWSYDKLISSDELHHHGIKGQKWGVRRFQNKDGSLTPAGRKRYDEDGHSKKEIEKSKKAEQQRNNGLNVRRVAMSHRLNLEAKFREKGLSEEEAKKAASKRIKAELFVTAAAAATVASVVVYNKHKQNSTDRILDDVDFQRIVKLAEGKDPNTNHKMYVSYDNKDNIKYKGLYGTQLFNNTNKPGEVYKLNMKSDGPVKIASRNRAAKIFANLYENDAEFRDAAQLTLNTNKYAFTGFNAKYNAGKLTTKDLTGKGYDAFNRGLAGKAPSERIEKQLNKFFDKIKEEGFNAIEDINDKKYSGYKSKDPIITLDGMKLTSKEKLSPTEMADIANDIVLQKFAKGAIRNGATYVAVKGLTIYNTKAEDRELIRQYKKEHPNTKMSDSEIISSLKPHR